MMSLLAWIGAIAADARPLDDRRRRGSPRHSALNQVVEARDWERIQAEIEDLLFPQRDLDVWERVVYYHLLRQTRTIGIEQALVAIQPLSIALRVGKTKVVFFRAGRVRLPDLIDHLWNRAEGSDHMTFHRAPYEAQN